MRGSALPVFSGVDVYGRRGHRGGGIGSALTGLLRSVLPALAPVAKNIGGRLISAGVRKLEQSIGSKLGINFPKASRDGESVDGSEMGRSRRRRRGSRVKKVNASTRRSRSGRVSSANTGAGGARSRTFPRQRGSGVNRKDGTRRRKKLSPRVGRSVRRRIRSREDVFT